MTILTKCCYEDDPPSIAQLLPKTSQLLSDPSLVSLLQHSVLQGRYQSAVAVTCLYYCFRDRGSACVSFVFLGCSVDSASYVPSVSAIDPRLSRNFWTFSRPSREGEGKGVGGRPAILSWDICDSDRVVCSWNAIAIMKLLQLESTGAWSVCFIVIEASVSIQFFR